MKVMKDTKETRRQRKNAEKNKQPQMTAEEVEQAYEIIIESAIKRAEAKRNEPSGEGRLSLLKRDARRARGELKAVAVDIARGVSYFDALERNGFDHLSFTGEKVKDQAYKMCLSAAQEIRDSRLGDKCLEAFSRLLEGDNPNVKAVLAGMEHLCGAKWQRGSGDGVGTGGGAKIVYNIQLLHAPRAAKLEIGCEKGARNPTEDDVIEVEPVKEAVKVGFSE